MGLLINSKTGILNYYNNINVNQYHINVFYNINDVSGFTTFNLLVKPYFNYITESTIQYGNQESSILPNSNPQGGTFSLIKYYTNININSLYGIITFEDNINVDSYIIPIIYKYNDISSTYFYTLNITKKVVYANFVVNNKIYDGTTDINTISAFILSNDNVSIISII